MITLDGHSLTPRLLKRIAHGEEIALDGSALSIVGANRSVLESMLAEEKTIYGLNTGFGRFANVRIPTHELDALQLNLLRSHAAGVGTPLTVVQTRALMAARINTLLKGFSGIRPSTVEALAQLLNENIIPYVPSLGSVGASGDLAPLAHIGLTLVGEGLAWNNDQAVPSLDVLKAKKIQPIVLKAKEGLALVNGTQFISALASLALADLEVWVPLADEIAALSVEALRGSRVPFDAEIHEARPHQGQVRTAQRMRDLLGETSPIGNSHIDCQKVQDPYSLRCIPQVHGVSKDALEFASTILIKELNSATDNPMVFTQEGTCKSGGNFHGQYPAFACDVLAIAVADLGSISERRQERMVNPAYSDLPAFLTSQGGLESGFMMAHVTSAALVSEMKSLAHPASVDSIPTSAGQEDHVSMGPLAARQLGRSVDALILVLSIEARMALEGIRLIGLQPAEGLHPLLHQLGSACPPWHDRNMSLEIEQTKVALSLYISKASL